MAIQKPSGHASEGSLLTLKTFLAHKPRCTDKQLTNGRVAEHHDAGAEKLGPGQLQIQPITNSPQ